MRVLLLGKSGMLGSCFADQLKRDDILLFAYDKPELDITNFAALKRVFDKVKPEMVINCAAYTEVDDCESNPEIAFKINADAVGKIAGLCKKAGAILIHFSTDYVFDGCKKGYREDDVPSPINVYGESKLKGEKLIQENMNDYFLIRTSWLFGREGPDFVRKMLELAKSNDELDVVADQVGSPTYADDLCEAVIRDFILARPVSSFGIYHLTNVGTCSWYQFSRWIFEMKNLPVRVNKVNSDHFVRPARRPHNSTLINSQTEKLRPWQKALQDYLENA